MLSYISFSKTRAIDLCKFYYCADCTCMELLNWDKDGGWVRCCLNSSQRIQIYIYINSCCLWYLKWDYSLHCIMKDQVLHCPHLSPTHTHWTSLKVLLPPYLLTASNNQPQGLCTLYSYLRDFNFFEVSLKHTLQVRPSLTLYIKHHTLAHLIHHPTYLALFFSQ